MVSGQQPRNHLWDECVRCHEMDSVDEAGLCPHCYWGLRAEMDHGHEVMCDYLRAWARFAEWCDARGQTTH